MKVTTILRRARKLIAKGWAQGYYAYDKSGKEIDPCERGAVTFCALGAISRVAPTTHEQMIASLALVDGLPRRGDCADGGARGEPGIGRLVVDDSARKT